MPRYIDADLLIKNIASIEDLRTLSTKTIGEAIDKTPTADVAEVKHGEWEKHKLVGCEPFYLCSVCGQLHNQEYSYCNECGAKMDGGNAE